MENDIAMYAMSYVLIRIVLIAGFGALVIKVLTRSASPLAATQRVRTTGLIRADAVRQDRC